MVVRTGPGRRPPLDPAAARRYRVFGRGSGRRRTGQRAGFVIAAWVALALAGTAVIARAGGELRLALSDLGSEVGSAAAALLAPSGGAKLDVDPAALTLAAQPYLGDLPEYTATAGLVVQGRVPAFALAPDRSVEIALNGQVLGRVQPDAEGRFTQRLELRQGENAIVAALVEGERRLSSTSAVVVLSTTPPPLSLVRPRPGATVDGLTVVVEGRSAPGARITVNDRLVAVAPDGSFSESYTASPGPQTIEIVATDRAGNQTRERVPIVVRAAAASGLALAVALDRASARPGQYVSAAIRVTQDGRPRGDVLVSLTVGGATVGTDRTDERGIARVGFEAPPIAGEIGVIAVAGTASGRATLVVTR